MSDAPPPLPDGDDPWTLLGVEPGADRRTIKRAYFKLSKEFHPDRYFRKEIGDYAERLERIFKKVLEAHEMLSDPDLCQVENQPESDPPPSPEAAAARLAAAVAAGYSVVFLVAGIGLIALLTDLASVRETAAVYLPWLIASPLISVWCFLYDGVYVGMTRAREMRNIMLISTFLVFVPLWYVTRPFGNHGLWFAFMLFLAARGIGMHLGYRRALQKG